MKPSERYKIEHIKQQYPPGTRLELKEMDDPHAPVPPGTRGNVWTAIISLRREDAERLGFNTGARWRDLLRTQTELLSTNLKIPMNHLRWYAAFHNESHHPYVHLIAYSTDPTEGRLTPKGVENIRSALAKDIFAQDLLCTYQRQTGIRDELRSECQDTIFGGFAPNSKTAEALSANLGNRTVLSGQITQNKDNPSQSLQMMQRPLMTADELKSMPKGSFVVMKTGSHPVKVKLKLFFEWGIKFEKPLVMPDRGSRPVYYASKSELEAAIIAKYPLIRMESVQPPVNKNLKIQQQQKAPNLKTKT